jgi:hypothetical protein
MDFPCCPLSFVFSVLGVAVCLTSSPDQLASGELVHQEPLEPTHLTHHVLLVVDPFDETTIFNYISMEITERRE